MFLAREQNNYSFLLGSGFAPDSLLCSTERLKTSPKSLQNYDIKFISHNISKNIFSNSKLIQASDGKN